MSTSMLLLSLAPYNHSMSTFRDLGHNTTCHNGSRIALKTIGKLGSKILPVIRDIKLEVADMRRIFREDNVTSELAWGEPEGKVWNIVKLEFCMNPAEENRSSFKVSGEAVQKD